MNLLPLFLGFLAVCVAVGESKDKLTLENTVLRLAMNPDGTEVRLTDLRRAQSWILDPATHAFRWAKPGLLYTDDIPGKIEVDRQPFGPGRVKQTGDEISVEYDLGRPVVYRWTLRADHLELTVESRADDVEYLALPGAWFPAEGPPCLALPVYQGVLWRPSGHKGESTRTGGGHNNWSMAMGAVLGEKAALLVTQETEADWAGTRGEGDRGPFFVFEQRRSAIDGWYPRQVRIYPVDKSITAICKRYRQRLIERGEFRSWKEKIAARPIVKNLFGALIAFVGYNQTNEIDYVDSARRLKESGFDTVFYYSTRMCQRTLNFKMGNDNPIWLSDEVLARMKAIPGTFLAPWGWLYEALDDGSPEARSTFILGADGKFVPNWKIDNFQWYKVCTPYIAEEMQRRYLTDMRAMDWIHYDVVAMKPGVTCFCRDHALHGNRPQGRREGMAETRRLLGPEVNGNRVVSSEGFVDRYAMAYDIGSSKLMPAWGSETWIPVPMTMLVLHDSCIQDWWEMYNYNAHGDRGKPTDVGVGLVYGGQAEKKAAMDALYGLPPNLFPFGKQYGWKNVETRESYSYLVRLQDPEVQRAIRAALPVARLHKRIGMQEMIDFQAVTDDFAVQTSVFADGTRIVANLSDEDRETRRFGLIKANSWKAIR